MSIGSSVIFFAWGKRKHPFWCVFVMTLAHSDADLLCKTHKGWQVCSSVFTRCSDLLVSHQRNGEEKVSANQSWLGSDLVSQFIPGRMIPTLLVIFIAWIQQQKLQLCCIEGLSRHVVVCFILLFHPVIFLNKGIPEESSLVLPPSRCRHVPHCWRWRSRWMVGLVGWMLGWMDEWMDGDGATCEISVFESWRPSFVWRLLTEGCLSCWATRTDSLHIGKDSTSLFTSLYFEEWKPFSSFFFFNI